MHYANGRAAKLGDLVVGYGYNTKSGDHEMKKLAGTLVKAIPDSNLCNAEIEFIEALPLDAPAPRMAVGAPERATAGDGKVYNRWICRDYTHCGALLHVEDVILLVTSEHQGYLKPVVVPEHGTTGRTVNLDTGEVAPQVPTPILSGDIAGRVAHAIPVELATNS